MTDRSELENELIDRLRSRIPQLPFDVLLLLEDVMGEEWETYCKPDRLRLGMMARELIDSGQFALEFIDKNGSNKCRYQRLAN